MSETLEERKALPGRRSVTTWRRRPARTIVVAGVSLAAGAIVAVSALWHAPFDLRAARAPAEVTACLSGAFAILALFRLLAGLRAAIRIARLRARAAENPEAPWLGDHEWQPAGIGETDRPEAGRALLGAALLALLLAPLNVWAFGPARSDLALQLTVACFDVAVPVALARAVALLIRRRRSGVSRLSFRRFPFFTGSKLEVQLESTGADFSAFRCLILRLRLVEETCEKLAGRSRLVRSQLYFDEQELSPDQLEGARGGVQASLRIPRGVPETQLASEPVRYWELEVQGEAPGQRYRACFLVPVYSPPPQLLARLAAACEPREEVDLQLG